LYDILSLLRINCEDIYNNVVVGYPWR